VTDQPIFEARYIERHSRLTTFFRLLLAIPHFVVLYVWSILAFFAIVIAWFAIVFTGDYPRSLYDFVAALQRYQTSVYGYVALLADDYPPFGGDTAGYPTRLVVPPPKAEYNRVKTLLRIFLMIPVLIIVYAMQIVWEVGAFLAWFVIVITGKLPKGLHDMIVLGLSYQSRAYCYVALLTEDWPPFIGPESAALAGGPGEGSGLPPAPSTQAPPVAPEAPRGAGELSGGDPLNP
jgi:hypothetical protein